MNLGNEETNPCWNDFKSHRLFPFSMSGFACLESWFDSDDRVAVQKQEAVRSKTYYAWCLQMSRVPDGTRFACCMLCSIHSIQLFIRLYLRGVLHLIVLWTSIGTQPPSKITMYGIQNQLLECGHVLQPIRQCHQPKTVPKTRIL